MAGFSFRKEPPLSVFGCHAMVQRAPGAVTNSAHHRPNSRFQFFSHNWHSVHYTQQQQWTMSSTGGTTILELATMTLAPCRRALSN